MPPVNDNVASRQVLAAGGGSVGPVTIDGATIEAGEPQGSNVSHLNQTIWFEWTPAAGGLATIDLAGSLATDGNGDPHGGLDTTLAVWTASDPTDFATFVEAASNDDLDATHYTSKASFVCTAGTTYLIQIGTYGAAYTGTVQLAYTAAPYSPDTGNDSCGNAVDLSGATSGHREADNRGWAGTWPTGADPLFNYYGHGGGAPLWWKWTNPGPTPAQFKATIVTPADSGNEISTNLNVGVMKGVCGSLAIDPSDPHLIAVVDQMSVSAPGSVDIVVDPGETVFLEIDSNCFADTSEPPDASACLGTFAFDWLTTTTSTQDCLTAAVALGDAHDGQADMGSGAADNVTVPYDSILVGTKLYFCFELDYYAGPGGTNPHFSYRVGSINTDGTGLTTHVVEDHLYKDFDHFPGANAVHSSGGGFGVSGASPAQMFLAFDGTDVLLTTISKEGQTPSGPVRYYVNVYREDAGAWTNICSLVTADSSVDSFETYRIAACPAGPRKLWLGMIGPYIDYTTGQFVDRFTRYEIDTAAGTATTLYDDISTAGSLAGLAAVGSYHWQIVADDGYPILVWEKHTGFDGGGVRTGSDGFLTVERFDTKAAIRTIHPAEISPGQADTPVAGGTLTLIRPGRPLMAFSRFDCTETAQFERFLAVDGYGGARHLVRIKSDFTAAPEHIDTAAFNPDPGDNVFSSSGTWAVNEPLYDGTRNVWSLGVDPSPGPFMFQYDRRCAHDWLEAAGFAFGTLDFQVQKGGWDTDLYFYYLAGDLNVYKVGPVTRDCTVCFPPIAAAIHAWQRI